MQVIKNYLYNAFYQMFILLVPLITTPYLARVLGPEGVGINSYTNSIIQYFILFGSIGVNLYGNRQIAFVRDNRKKMTKTFYEIFFMKIITITIVYFVFILFVNFTNKYSTYYWAQSLSIIAAGFDISWFFMGMEDFFVTIIRNFIVKMVTLICIFIFVKTPADLNVYILILSLSLLIGNLTLFPSLKKYIGRVKFLDLHIWRHLLPSIMLFIPQIATQIYLVVNKTMLGSLVSVTSAGFFDQSDKIIKMVLAVVTATGTVMLPHVASAYANGKHEKTRIYLYKSFSFVTAISVPMVFGLAAVASKFVPLFFTKQFNAVTPLLMSESIVILFIAWSNVLGTQYLLPTKQTRYYTISVILGAVVNIALNIPLIIVFGAQGAVIATVGSELVVTAYQLLIVKEQVSISRMFKGIYKYFISGGIMFCTVFYMDKILGTSWIALVSEVAFGMAIYLILLIIFKSEIIKDALTFMSKN